MRRTRNRPPTINDDLNTALLAIQITTALWPAARAIGRALKRDYQLGTDVLGAG